MNDNTMHALAAIEPRPRRASERLSDALSDLRSLHPRVPLHERVERMERALMLALATLAEVQEERDG